MAPPLEQDEVPGRDCKMCLVCILCCVLVPASIAGLITVIVLGATSKHPVYSVTVTGVSGLDPSAANPSSSSSLSPMFNLTVRIDNSRGQLSGASCIERFSTVSVSYGDAVLGRGCVPQFCVKEGKVRERGARAWGKDVAVPKFLQDELAGELAAGEAAVDVKVTTPAEFNTDTDSDTVFVCSQAKIGGGPATCRKERVANHGQQATPGTTG